jgi:glutathione S-transferase
MIKFYSLKPSGNAQKVRLALSFLCLEYEEIMLSGGAHKRPEFLALNPLGQVPVIIDDGFVVRDSLAILVYLAAAYAPGRWDGETPQEKGSIAQWLALAAGEIKAGATRLRAAKLFNKAIDDAAAQSVTLQVLEILQDRLETRDWLECDRLTIADLACAPYLALAHQGSIDLAPFPAIEQWIQRIAALPNFPAMDGWASNLSLSIQDLP